MPIKTIYEFPVTKADKTKVAFAFKKPSRAEREDADMWHAAWVNKCLERGLAPQALVIKLYANAGGTFNNAEKAEFDSIRSQLLAKQLEHETSMIGTDLVLRDRLTTELLDLRERFIKMQQSQETFFANTAEAKARNKLIEWLVLHLSYYRIDETKDWQPFFVGDDTESKIGYLEKLEDAEDELYKTAIDQLTFVAALFVSLNGNLKKEDIDAFLATPVETTPAVAPATNAPVTPIVEAASQPAA